MNNFVNVKSRCDSSSDCDDNSDEEDCEPEIKECEASSQFTCGNKCIKITEKCDGIEDCDDHSDEFNCTIVCDEGKKFKVWHKVFLN